jgi:flagellar protein FliO/FliZ
MNPALIQTALSLLFVISLILVLSYVYNRFFWQKGGRTSSLLTILATLPLGIKEKLVLVKCMEKYFLLGFTPHHISLIHTFNDEKELIAFQNHFDLENGFRNFFQKKT